MRITSELPMHCFKSPMPCAVKAQNTDPHCQLENITTTRDARFSHSVPTSFVVIVKRLCVTMHHTCKYKPLVSEYYTDKVELIMAQVVGQWYITHTTATEITGTTEYLDLSSVALTLTTACTPQGVSSLHMLITCSLGRASGSRAIISLTFAPLPRFTVSV